MKQDILLAKLRKVLHFVLRRPVPMTVLLDPEIKAYTPEQVCKVVLDTYVMALSDVLDFVDGDTLKLEELTTPDGKGVAVDTSERMFVIRVPKRDVVS
jgi:hypothetical protein